MIMGEEQADAGSFNIGDTVEIGYVDQRHADIDPQKTVWEVISGGNEQLEIGGKAIQQPRLRQPVQFQRR